MIKIFILFYIFSKLTLMLRIYQQSHYNLKEYAVYMIKNFAYINGFVILVFLIVNFANLKEVTSIGYSCIFLFGIALYFKSKVSLIYTKRIKRLITINLILTLFLLINNKWITFIGTISYEYISMPLFLISSKVEKKINNRYIVEASTKLELYNGYKIAVTGSYGKTSTKYYLGEIMSSVYPTLYTKMSYNTMLGISKVVNEEALDKYDYFITEMGANHVGDIEELMNLVKPNLTILTSIGYMHLDTFKTIDNIVTEKCKVADMLNENEISIVNFENEFIRNHKFKNKVVSYGLNHGDYQAKNIVSSDTLSFDVYKNNIYFSPYKTKIGGLFNVLNLLAVIACLDTLGFNKDIVRKEIWKLSNVKNRLNITISNNRTILDDSFNSNIDGAIHALEEMKKYDGKKIIITPGFVEIHSVLDKLNSRYASKIAECCDYVFLVGKHETKDLSNKLYKLNTSVYIFNSFKEAYRTYNKIANKTKTVLLIENDLPDIYKRGF